jgi:uncharacterized protein
MRLMNFQSCIYAGWVMHRRLSPTAHRFRYRAWWLFLDLDELAQLERGLRCFSLGRFNLFSLYERDYGEGCAPLRKRIEAQLHEAGIDIHGGPIRLLTMPRAVGYAFNPLSVFYCYRANGHLAAIVYEVHNTFGERHRYIIETASNEDGVVRQEVGKAFHVSPFMAMDMHYAFRVGAPATIISLGITASDMRGGVMHAVLKGQRHTLTDRALLRLFVTHPLVTLKVIGAIHWEAFRLWRKRIAIHSHPAAGPAVTVIAAHQPVGRNNV